MVSQIKGEFETKEDRMIKYLLITKRILARFQQFFVSQIPKGENENANALPNFTSSVPIAYHVNVQILDAPSTVEAQAKLVEEGFNES